MIGYPIKLAALERAIESKKKGWLERARGRTKTFRRSGSYQEKSTIWGEVKTVYVDLQNAKCAFCERKLEDDPPGKAQHDVEHFRPKSSVKPWPVPRSLVKQAVPFTPPAQATGDQGYYLLAYHPFNYATSCKTCNSYYKGNYFPIAGKRRSDGADPAKLRSERPYLIYPVGAVDEDPEELIRFHGVSPQAKVRRGYRRHRALVTIAFFDLDGGKRKKTLYRERSEVITSLWSFLELSRKAESAAERKTYRALVDAWTSPSSSHTNCAKCFRELCRRDPAEAKSLFKAAAVYLDTISK